LLIIISILSCAFGQNPAPSISGPVLGFIQDPEGSAIQPILGVPGASVLGAPLSLASEIRSAVISPNQDYAVAVRGDNAEVVLIGLSLDSVTMNSLDGIRAGVDVMAISPVGTAIALYGYDSKIFQSVVRFADSPEVVFEIDTSDTPGRLRGMAVSDDGKLALLNFADGENSALWVVNSTGSRFLVPADQPAAQSFVPNRHNVVVGDNRAQEVFMLVDADGATNRIPLASFGDGFDAISGVAASDDGLRVFVTSRSSENVSLVDVQTGQTISLSCHCRSTGLQRLKGPNVFRLSNTSDGAIALLDDSSSPARITLVPARGCDRSPRRFPFTSLSSTCSSKRTP
jgi:hypothetical protein